MWLVRWLADADEVAELRERADRGSYHAPSELAGRLAAHDMADELRERAFARDGQHAARALAVLLAERGRHKQLRDFFLAADPGRRPLILEAAATANLPGARGLRVRRVLADLGSEAAKFGLARCLASEGRLDELRERAESGDVYAQGQLTELPG